MMHSRGVAMHRFWGLLPRGSPDSLLVNRPLRDLRGQFNKVFYSTFNIIQAVFMPEGSRTQPEGGGWPLGLVGLGLRVGWP